MNGIEFANSIHQAQADSRRPQPGPAVGLWARLKREARIRMRGGWEQGGYVHDTATSIFISPGAAFHTIGTWTDTVGNVALTYMKRRTGAAATNQLVYPITFLPQNSVALKGSYLKTIDLWYEISTAAMTTVTHALDLATLPAAAAAVGNAFAAPVAQTITFDSFHNTNALRVAIGKHHTTITLTTPVWLGPNDLMYLDTTMTDPGTSVWDDYGIRVNFTLRI
jgi:hypothetical protein